MIARAGRRRPRTTRAWATAPRWETRRSRSGDSRVRIICGRDSGRAFSMSFIMRAVRLPVFVLPALVAADQPCPAARAQRVERRLGRTTTPRSATNEDTHRTRCGARRRRTVGRRRFPHPDAAGSSRFLQASACCRAARSHRRGDERVPQLQPVVRRARRRHLRSPPDAARAIGSRPSRRRRRR